MTKRILVDAVHPEEIRVAVADDAKLIEFDFESLEKKQLKSNIYLGKITRVEPSLQAAFVEYGGNRQGFLPFSEIHYDYYQIPVEDKEKLQQALVSERKREEQRIHDQEMRESQREAENARDRGSSENNQENELYSGFNDDDNSRAPENSALHSDENAGEENSQNEYGGSRRRERSSYQRRGARDRDNSRERDSSNGDSGNAEFQNNSEDKPRERNNRRDRNDRRGGRDRDKSRGAARRGGRQSSRPYLEIPEPFTKSDLHDLLRAEELAKEFTLEIMGEEYFNEKYGNPAAQVKEIEETQMEITSPAELEMESIAESINEPSMDSEMEHDHDSEIETQGGEERQRSSMEFYKQYKIQEVIKRNQIVLIQIVKEERGSKGASLTTYLALAGRYCVFMPNTDKGGGVSRRISNFSERRRIRDVIRQLDTTIGTSVIIRTAGMEREFDDIKKDYDYLLSVWDNIRKQTMQSSAPALIYEESDIVKRSLRDMLKADVSEVHIEGEETYKSARKFMEVIGPNQVNLVKQYTGKVPIFQKFRIEEKLDELYDPEVKLESGGSIVITPTEALVSIDVNSGKATKERSVEDTAVKTNMEAAREIARQLKMRDLAGLIVIDFIDMREMRNRKAVERELKDALKADKAKIQIGRISAFGLLEMSRQRLRSSLVESSSTKCPMCRGIGVVRTMESLTLKAIRAIENEAGKKTVKEIYVRASMVLAHNINHRSDEIKNIEKNDNVKIVVEEDASLLPNQFELSTQKFSRNEQTRQKNEKQAQPNESRRPQQNVEASASIPSESEIDADVDEQLAAWQKEVADVEKMENRRFDGNENGERRNNRNRNNNNRNGRNNNNNNRNRRYDNRAENRSEAPAETATQESNSVAETAIDHHNSIDERSDNRQNNNRGGARNNRNNGGSNSNNRNRNAGSRNNGRNNDRNRGRNNRNNNNRYNNNYNGDNFGNQSEEAGNGNFSGSDNIERIDNYQEKREQNPAPKENNEAPSENKQAASKLSNLWKKITS